MVNGEPNPMPRPRRSYLRPHGHQTQAPLEVPGPRPHDQVPPYAMNRHAEDWREAEPTPAAAPLTLLAVITCLAAIAAVLWFDYAFYTRLWALSEGRRLLDLGFGTAVITFLVNMFVLFLSPAAVIASILIPTDNKVAGAGFHLLVIFIVVVLWRSVLVLLY